MDGVADVVEVAGDVGQLVGAPVMAQTFQDILGDVAHQPGVPLAVLGVPQRAQRFVGTVQEGQHFGVAAHFVDGDEMELGTVRLLIRVRSSLRG